MITFAQLRLTAVALVAAFAARAGLAQAERPNLVFFISDDHSQLDSTVYGSKDVKTPNMERLAQAGLTFDRAFVASPTCAPSRAAMLTGLYPYKNGAEPNHAYPRFDVKKLPAYLHELGYEVVAFGKVSHYQQTALYGFDHFEHDKFHEDIAVSAAIDWLKARKSKKPLCLFVGTNWPHVPWPKDPEGFTPDGVHLPPTQVDTPRTRDMRTLYYTAISTMDTELGQVYDTVNQVLGQNTFFLHSSDNGAQWPFGKWCLYDAGIREPMIAVWPGHVKPGTRTDAMVSWLDILPTLIEVAGGTPPTDIDGRSFVGVLRGEKQTHRDRIFTTHSGDGQWNIYPARSVRTTDWKYIRNLHPEFYFSSHVDLAQPQDGAGYFRTWEAKAKTDAAAAAIVQRYHIRPPEELYDLRSDPYELHNLAGDARYAQQLASLRAEVDAWMKETGDPGKVYGKPRLIDDPHRNDPPGAAAKKKKK